MTFRTSLIGSYPPIDSSDRRLSAPIPDQIELKIRSGIERAISDQIELGVDYLVDGQMRDNAIELFTQNTLGFSDETRTPYKVVGRIESTDEPVAVSDFRFAQSLAKDKSFKAHIIGPMTIASSCVIDSSSPYATKNDPHLFADLAKVLGQVARYFVLAGAEIIQIDEPTLSFGVDLETEFDTINRILDIGNARVSVLHMCGDIRGIIKDVVNLSPTDIISIEGVWLRDSLDEKRVDRKYLIDCKKKIELGCVNVNNDYIEKVSRVRSFVWNVVDRLGDDRIWAIAPNCGMRMLPYEIAKEKLKVMVDVARNTKDWMR